MIRECSADAFDAILEVINAAAQRYAGVIPADRWKEPYMSRDELRHELADGVVFWGFYVGEQLVGVAGLQDRGDVALIRHAYVHPDHQRQGIGSALLTHLRAQTNKPTLIGTWAACHWATAFYRKHGYQLVRPADKDILLRRYWSIPARQVETSVVLAEPRWYEQPRPERTDGEGPPHNHEARTDRGGG
ncbi:MAG: GNAT family N-acetyltransferase [Anaerolineae bacterium]|nr:GNAT family N-acetyltransferase [Anaerolineae bacterium]